MQLYNASRNHVNHRATSTRIQIWPTKKIFLTHISRNESPSSFFLWTNFALFFVSCGKLRSVLGRQVIGAIVFFPARLPRGQLPKSRGNRNAGESAYVRPAKVPFQIVECDSASSGRGPLFTFRGCCIPWFRDFPFRRSRFP